MVFSSLECLFFYLPAVLLIYFLIPTKFLAARNLMLLIVSLLFYGWSEPSYIWIMFLSIAVDYTCGRFVTIFSIVPDFISRICFKYAGSSRYKREYFV